MDVEDTSLPNTAHDKSEQETCYKKQETDISINYEASNRDQENGNCWDVICFIRDWTGVFLALVPKRPRVASPGFELGWQRPG